MIKHFRALLKETLDATRHATLDSNTRQVLYYLSRNKVYISDVQRHTMVLCIYQGIQVQDEGVDGERISQMYLCRESQSCHRGDRQNARVWVE
jgi:hypothetical protein